MKNNNLSQLKTKLIKLKMRRTKYVIWKLSKEEREYVEKELDYEVVPELYEIRTKSFKCLSEIKDSIIRDIHYANKRNKKTMVMKLKRKDMEILEAYHIKFYPYKFKIFLN